MPAAVTELAEGWLVLAVVAHEHIVDFRFGGLSLTRRIF